jgi:chromosome partitioning protein
MIVTVASFKGGVGKTTSAIHIASYLQQQKPTLLIDGDANRSSLRWHRRGPGLPFKVCDEMQGPRFAREFEHIVIDTAARPSPDELETLTEGCDVLVVPCSPDALSMDVLGEMVDSLRGVKMERFRVLLTMVPPKPNTDGQEAKETLEELGFPLLEGFVRWYHAFKKAAVAGVPVCDVKRDPNAREAWRDYETVCRELCR